MRRRTRRGRKHAPLIAVLALLALAAGCAGSDASETSARETAGAVTVRPEATAPLPAEPFPGAGVNCPAGEPAPITIGEALRALRAHGFTVDEIERSCGLHLVSGMITSTAPGALSGEGSLTCFVLALRHRDVPDVVDGDTAAAHAERRLANLDCDLYGSDAVGFESDEVRRLDLAFVDLQRTLHR